MSHEQRSVVRVRRRTMTSGGLPDEMFWPDEDARYQYPDFPHNKVKAPRRENVRGHDMTEVTAMPAKSNRQFESGDTDDRLGRIVGVEDADGRAWCFECAHEEIRRAGETAYMADLYAWSARRKCVNCGRRIGEVTG